MPNKHRRNFLKQMATAGTYLGASFAALPVFSLAKEMSDASRYLTLKDIDIFTLQFPKKTPLTWNAIKKSGGNFPSVTYLKLTTDQGIEGYAITKGNPNDIKKFANKLKGLNLLNIEQVWQFMFSHNRKPVAKGKEIHAIGSVDLALWDIIGKALQQPVHRLLGTYKTEVPAYAAGGYYADGKGIKELVSEMESYVSEGHNIVKMKIAGESVHDDAKRVKAVVEALGQDARVMVDANNGYTSAYEAIRFGRLVENLDLYWFEEPVIPYDWRGNAEVKKALDIPITAGENEYTRYGALDLLSNNACDIINIDTIKGGGITEMRKIAALCSAYHVPVSPHGYAHMNIHILASISNGSVLETYPKKALDFNPALPAFKVTNGMVTVPQEIGLGMEPDPLLVKKYKV